MPQYRVTFAYGYRQFGATETWISRTVSQANSLSHVQELLDKRNAILSEDAYWQGVRISVYGGNRKSIFLPPGEFRPFDPNTKIVIPGNGAYVPATAAGRQDQWRSCVQLRLNFDTDRQTTRYLAPVPDDIVVQEGSGVYWANNPGFLQRYRAWTDEIINKSWAIKARDRSGSFTPINIVSWTNTGTGAPNLGAVIPATPDPGIAEGEFITIQGVRRKGNDKLSYNGRYVVDKVDSTTQSGKKIIFLRETSTGVASSIKLLGTIQRIGFAVFPVQQIQAIRPGVHKRGKPSSGPRGRRTTRVSLDP